MANPPRAATAPDAVGLNSSAANAETAAPVAAAEASTRVRVTNPIAAFVPFRLASDFVFVDDIPYQ